MDGGGAQELQLHAVSSWGANVEGGLVTYMGGLMAAIHSFFFSTSDDALSPLEEEAVAAGSGVMLGSLPSWSCCCKVESRSSAAAAPAADDAFTRTPPLRGILIGWAVLGCKEMVEERDGIEKRRFSCATLDDEGW